MSLKVLIRCVYISDTAECDRDLKLDGDLIEVIGLQTYFTVLNVKWKSESVIWNGKSNTALDHHLNTLYSTQWTLVKSLLKKG